MNPWPLVLLFLGGVILTIGDIFMKRWVVTNELFIYLVGMVIYVAGLNFLAQSFKFENIAVASIIFVIFNVVTLTLFSWLYFKEPLSIIQVAGIILGLTSVFLLEMF